MATGKCPGQNTMFWTMEDVYDVPCSHCRAAVEFFKTDITRKCPECGQKLLNPKADLSCAEWCARAEDCLGPIIYDQLQEKREREQRREEHLDRLMSTVEAQDEEVRQLFQWLYEDNSDLRQLLDFDRLRALREENPSLVDRATQYYSQFVQGAAS